MSSPPHPNTTSFDGTSEQGVGKDNRLTKNSASSPELSFLGRNILEDRSDVDDTQATLLPNSPTPVKLKNKNKNIKMLVIKPMQLLAPVRTIVESVSPITPAVSSMYSEPDSPILEQNSAPLPPLSIVQKAKSDLGISSSSHGHMKNQSVVSIRQSSYDLLLVLKEIEEREKRKAMGTETPLGMNPL
jgi:hypothetical protein